MGRQWRLANRLLMLLTCAALSYHSPWRSPDVAKAADQFRRRRDDVRPTPCVSNTPPAMEVWNCVRDEGRPLDAGDQEPAPNHRELLSLRAMVVSVAEKAGLDPVR